MGTWGACCMRALTMLHSRQIHTDEDGLGCDMSEFLWSMGIKGGIQG